jgi:hypothetical protein
MVEQRFNDLHDALLRAGVARRHARRAVLELESHFQQLTSDARAAGASAADSCQLAHRLLGTNDALLERYVAQPELRTWSRRWPSVCFVLLPLSTYLAVLVGILVFAVAAGHFLAPSLRRIHLTPRVTHGIDLTASAALLWILPLLVAAGFVALAHRRRVRWRWPAMSILVICALASLVNVGLRLTGGGSLGSVSAGIGLSATSLPGQVKHLTTLVALASVLPWLLRRRALRDDSVS